MAYYPLYVVQRTLHKKGFHHYWNTLRHHFNGQVRVTTTLVNDKGQVISIRQTAEPEPVHVTNQQALDLCRRPLETVKRIKREKIRSAENNFSSQRSNVHEEMTSLG